MHNQKLLVQETHLEQLLKWMLASEITARIDQEYLHFNDAKDDLKDISGLQTRDVPHLYWCSVAFCSMGTS